MKKSRCAASMSHIKQPPGFKANLQQPLCVKPAWIEFACFPCLPLGVTFPSTLYRRAGLLMITDDRLE